MVDEKIGGLSRRQWLAAAVLGVGGVAAIDALRHSDPGSKPLSDYYRVKQVTDEIIKAGATDIDVIKATLIDNIPKDLQNDEMIGELARHLAENNIRDTIAANFRKEMAEHYPSVFVALSGQTIPAFNPVRGKNYAEQREAFDAAWQAQYHQFLLDVGTYCARHQEGVSIGDVTDARWDKSQPSHPPENGKLTVDFAAPSFHSSWNYIQYFCEDIDKKISTQQAYNEDDVAKQLGKIQHNILKAQGEQLLRDLKDPAKPVGDVAKLFVAAEQVGAVLNLERPRVFFKILDSLESDQAPAAKVGQVEAAFLRGELLANIQRTP